MMSISELSSDVAFGFYRRRYFNRVSNVCCSGFVFFFHYLFLFTKRVNSRDAEHKLTLGT